MAPGMKPQLLKVPTAPTHSFSVREDRDPYINNRWHYHAEVELIRFHKGCGTQFVGDNIKRFDSGDIILVGSNLPHYWRYDDAYFKGDKDLTVHSTVIHFSENFWGERFLHLPETKQIKNLFEKARRGVLVSGKEGQGIRGLAAQVEKIRLAEGLNRIIALIECLSSLAAAEELHLLSSIGFSHDFAESENDRINAIYDHSFGHFRQKIYLGEIAAVAGLVPNSFCRYFKSRTGKTYSQFLTEIRIGHACKLLIDNRLSIKQLCFESGFNNFTCFHKNFRLITGKSPQQYLKEHLAG
jgi:AraC-like DNA-binding protein